MSWVIFILGVLVGFSFGRVYGWMKYNYPEFQEQIHLKIAKTRAERARYEAEEEEYRQEIDRSIRQRVNT